MSDEERDFVAVAVSLDLLTEAEAKQIRLDSAGNSQPPELIAIQKSRLSAQDIDVIETIRRPRLSLPGYEILGLLGRGGMGVVYRARQLNLNREVALKTILIAAQTPSATARFEQEAQLAARLQHPNIISVYDFGRHNDRVFAAMELVQGRDAERVLKEGSGFSERVVWGVIRQAAAGLAHAAESGIIHRDIKPANLLLVKPPAGYDWPSELPMVKIADFGLASLAQTNEVATRLTQEGSTLGSPHYMAPEQFASAAVDLRADIYSLGATAFHLLTGRPPFANLSIAQIIGEKKQPPPDAAEFVSITDASRALLRDMLQPQRDQRIADYSDLLKRINDVLGQPAVRDLDSKPSSAPVIADMQTAESFSIDEAAGGTVEMTGSDLTLPDVPADAPGGSRFARWLQVSAAALLLACLAAGGFVGWAFWNGKPAPPPARPEFTIGDYAANLFNGRNMEGWRIVRGAWGVARNEDGANRIVGENGVIAHSTRKGADGEPLRMFRLTMLVELLSAKQFELQFGVSREQDQPSMYVLRLSDSEANILLREGGEETILETFSLSESRSRVVQLDRGNGYWWATVDGKTVTIPFRHTHQRPDFQLAANDGQIAVSDVTTVELIEPDE